MLLCQKAAPPNGKAVLLPGDFFGFSILFCLLEAWVLSLPSLIINS